MTALLLSSLLCAPAWATEVKVPGSAPDVTLEGAGAPSDLVLAKPKRALVLTLEGPAEVTLTLYGYVRGKPSLKNPRPGGVLVAVDGGERSAVALGGSINDAWRVPRRPAFRVTEGVEVPLSLTSGRHRIVLTPSPMAKSGCLVRLTVSRPPPALASATARNDVEPSEPALLENEAPVVAPPDEPAEPELVAPPTEDDVPLITDPAAGLSALPDKVGFVIAGAAPKTLPIVGQRGPEEFLWLTTEAGLVLDAAGPGTLVVDFHAHRDRTRKESLDPVLIALLIDDVLAERLALDQPESKEFTVEAPFVLGKRVTLRLPVPAGAHKIGFTVSDTAVLGVSARPRFEALGTIADPGVLTAEAARQDALTARNALGGERKGGILVGIYGGAGRASALASPGLSLGLGLAASLPIDHHLVAIELFTGYASGERTFAAKDARLERGVSETTVALTTVPLLLGVRWDAPLPAPLRFSLGVAAGVLLARNETIGLGTATPSGLATTLGGAAHLGVGIDVGPGAAWLRAQGTAGRPIDVGALRSFDPGGVSLLLGYELGGAR